MFLMQDLVDRAQGVNQPVIVEKTPPVKQPSLFFNYRGKTLAINELAKVAGMRPRTMRLRLQKGWSVEDAVNRPLQSQVAK